MRSPRGLETRRVFTLPEERFKAFKQTVREQQFFELGDHYGSESFQIITYLAHRRLGRSARMINQVHTVRLLDFPEPGAFSPAELEGAARAVRVFDIARGWFDEPEVPDERKYYKRVLDAADKQAQRAK